MIQKNRPRARLKRIRFILGALLVVNAGVAYTLIEQLTVRTSAQIQVQGVETTIEEGKLISENPNNPIKADAKPEIVIYTVQSGDTISGIAEKFNISVNTIRWANELDKKENINVGQKLVILPINGIQYTVKNGDTLSGISKKFETDAEEILSFNDVEDPNELKPGLKLIIPDAEPIVVETPAPKPQAKTTKPTSSTTQKSMTSNTPSVKIDTNEKEEDYEDYDQTQNSSTRSGYTIPVPGSVLTQGLHAVNAVDLAAPTGTPIYAIKSGTVIVAKGGGAYNGGFGNMIVIDHGNGTKSLYAHLSKVNVKVGDSIDQGEKIGNVGNTGRSTGPHVHLEVHGGKNVWAADKKGTKY